MSYTEEKHTHKHTNITLFLKALRVQRALLSFVDARSLSRGEIGVGAVRVGLVVFAKKVVFVDVYYVD